MSFATSSAIGFGYESTATFSPCRTYRYTLFRKWSQGNNYAMFIGLNPSDANETRNDPTIIRCINFAKAWGYAGLCMTNLFGFCATNPKIMLGHHDPVGPDNDKALQACAAGAGVVVAAWGAHGTHMDRNILVEKMIPDLHCLKLTKFGHPGHPLYLPKTLTPKPMNLGLATPETTL
jgi:hypothetical protein